MRPETKGRVAVGLIVSLLAFGLGTGTAIFSGYNNYPINQAQTNITPPGGLPPIFTTNNNTNQNTTNQNTQSSVQSHSSTNSGNDNLNNPSNQSTVTPTLNQTGNQSQPP
jgi:hypothetical protein